MLGMHLCGELGPQFVDAYTKCDDVIAMSLVPCCLSRHRQEVLQAASELGVDWLSHWAKHLGDFEGAHIQRDTHMRSEKNVFITATKTERN